MTVNKYPFPELLDDVEIASAINAHKEQVDYIFYSLVEHYGKLTAEQVTADLFSTNEEVYSEARLVANHVLSCITTA